MASRSFSTELLGFGTLSNKFRKPSAPSSNGDPAERFNSRRPSVQPLSRQSLYTPNTNHLTPILSPSIEALPAAPSIHPLERSDTFDSIETSSSPQQIAQDMVSASTVAAGPSVQLVEKLSAAIRRLESEKVATKEELARISAQRDEARAEMVTLMREVEKGRQAGEAVARLEAEVAEVNERYETTLELLGEKSEMVEELRADVQDVKAMYRDLVERTIK
ncbi:TATA element modulatory factor 1 TATA binding-domain-containing protein [Coniella lustricola]|uniref:TATA element modulatory factor 1 TATA binding-domain-containing protein n=1 Tax=Coniella lustricola TaxID=2025994 RepID=A0A2T3ACJ5_9PEZI|nr:TATA element modulatory factor 1 TATA binding-domain-containing protein [Coniella lustricola]